MNSGNNVEAAPELGHEGLMSRQARVLLIRQVCSAVQASVMTLMVLIMGAATLYALPLAPWSFAVKCSIAGANLFLWLITGFLWSRIAMERQRVSVIEPGYEQEERVWPPAPQTPKIK